MLKLESDLPELCIFRKVKKSESKSQRTNRMFAMKSCCVYSVKLKNLKANHNVGSGIAYVKYFLYLSCKFEYNGT